MKISLDDLIEHSFCIACNNADYKRFAEDFKKKLGVDKAPRMFRGFVFNVGFYPALGIWSADSRRRMQLGCGLSHYYVLKAARHLKWPYVCVFEDDFSFHNESSRDNLEKLLDNIPDDVDIAKFYCCTYNWASKLLVYKDTIKKELLTPTEMNNAWRGDIYGWGTQMYIEFKKAYDKRLYGIETLNLIADCEGFQDVAATQLECVKSSSDIGRQGILRGTTTKSQGALTGCLPALSTETIADTNHKFTEEEFSYLGHESLLRDLTTRHTKTYAAQTCIALLGCVKIAETMGWSQVEYETPRGKYIVEAKDYLRVQAPLQHTLDDIAFAAGVKFEPSEAARTHIYYDKMLLNKHREENALKDGLQVIKTNMLQ